MMHGNPGRPEPALQNVEAAPGPVPVDRPVYTWFHKFSAIVLIALCFEIGLFLLIFPWTEYWDRNYFSTFIPELRTWWMNMYFRGAVSGLGVVNLVFSFVEIFRLRRFARR